MLIVAFWAALAFAVTMALLPKPPHLPGNPGDKIQHMVAFAVLSSLASHAYWRSSPFRVGAALAFVGGLIEILQLIPGLNRDASLVDWLADCLAIGMVLAVTYLRER